MRRGHSSTHVFKVPILLSAIGLLAPGCAVDDELVPVTSTEQEIGNRLPDHDETSILVKFRNTPSAAALQDVLTRVGGKIQDANGDRRDDRFTHLSKDSLARVELQGPMRALEAIARLERHPAIVYAEPNYIVHATLIPNDASFGQLWGMNNTGQTGGTAGADISAVQAWDVSVGSRDVVVGVIDTGVDYTHPDLAANMWVNPGEIPGNGLDDDGNGYADDIHGINAITGTGDPMDDNDHGSHCAGTIGGVGNNGVGVAGVNWNVSIAAMKFLSGSGSGTTADAITGINYAVDLKLNRGVDIRVLSNSWGGGGFSQALEDAIVAANNADILFVAAAGNSATDNDTSPHYPSSYEVPNVVAVASTDHNDNLSSFSCFGATSVDLGAPGSSILSTTPGNTYQTFSGTSMATPHVTGAAALLLSVNNTLTVGELKDLLMQNGDPIPALAGKTVSGKRLNVDAAIRQVSPPGPSFRVDVSPTSQALNQGEAASYAVSVTSVAGYAGDVSLSLSSTPALNASVTFTPNPVPAGSSSTLSITTTTATATGDYTLTVTATDGVLTKTRAINLKVRPEGTTVRTFTNTTPVSVPDNVPAGVTSTLDVPESILISEVSVNVNITHTYIGDLLVTLTSPEGTTVTLHNRSGGSTDNLHATFTPGEYFNQDSFGNWILSVSDNAGADVGTLDSWSLTFTGVPSGNPGNLRPTAGFSFTTSGLTATFTDSSTDADGSITAWSWNFGDGATSTAQHPAHTYAAQGTYTVSLTVTDNGGRTDTTSKSVKVLPDGLVSRDYSNTTPVSIPDNVPAGITSTISVPDSIAISELSVSVNITHTYIGDLIVKLTSPSGTTVTLHNRSGGSADNLVQTYTPAEFNGQNTAGTWTLSVSDNAGIDVGTLNNWSLNVLGVPTGTEPPPPPPPPAGIALSVASAQRSGNNRNTVVLSWTGAGTASVEVYRDGALIATPANSGGYTDSFRSGGASFIYMVCETGGGACSNEATASF
jgi:serine protease